MVMNFVTKKRKLGMTDIEVTPIGLGCNEFSGGKGIFGVYFPDLPQSKVNAIVKAALDGGINWFDTAEMYGFGHSEAMLSQALKSAGAKDNDVVVATKWFPLFRTAGSITRTIDTRLRFLGGFEIDLYMVHEPWGFSSPEAEMDAMADLCVVKKIHSVGVSNFNVERMQRAHEALKKRGLTLAVNQVRYNLLHREIEKEGLVEAAKELGITLIAWGPLSSGLLTGKYHLSPERLEQVPFGRRMLIKNEIERSRPVIDALVEIAEMYGVTPAQVALNWLIHINDETVVAIPGATKVRHAKMNAEVMKFNLTEDDMARLDEVSAKLKL